MKKIVFSVLFLGLAIFVMAENNDKKTEVASESAVEALSIEFNGTITDQLSGESLAGVEVQIKGTELKTYTDFDGKFSFKNLKAGEYDLETSFISYKKNLIEDIKVDQTKNQVEIKLQSSN